MRILHISDTHGGMPTLLPEGDVIVHSGDLLPNRTFGIREIECTYQRYWLEENVAKLKRWIGDRPFLYTPGNHDYVDPAPVLRDVGVRTYTVCNGCHTLDGVTFYGFPWTPTFYDWNWMCGPEQMKDELSDAVDYMDQGAIDVFIAHGPMYGVLDRNVDGTRCGSRVVRAAMQEARHPPRLFLHGHIHESAGLIGWSRGIIVSNAALTQRVVEI